MTRTRHALAFCVVGSYEESVGDCRVPRAALGWFFEKLAKSHIWPLKCCFFRTIKFFAAIVDWLTTPACLELLRTDFLKYYQISYLSMKRPIFASEKFLTLFSVSQQVPSTSGNLGLIFQNLTKSRIWNILIKRLIYPFFLKCYSPPIVIVKRLLLRAPDF